MRKIASYLQICAVFFCLFSIILFGLTYGDISKIGQQNFDIIKWLDADIYLLRWGWYSLILAAFLSLTSLVLNIKFFQNKTTD